VGLGHWGGPQGPDAFAGATSCLSFHHVGHARVPAALPVKKKVAMAMEAAGGAGVDVVPGADIGFATAGSARWPELELRRRARVEVKVTTTTGR